MKTKQKCYILQLWGTGCRKKWDIIESNSVEERDQEKTNCDWLDWMSVFHPDSLQGLWVWMKDDLIRKPAVANLQGVGGKKDGKHVEKEFYSSHCNILHILHFVQDVFKKISSTIPIGDECLSPPFLMFP